MSSLWVCLKKEKRSSLKSTKKNMRCAMDISDLTTGLRFRQYLSDKQKRIATEVIKEMGSTKLCVELELALSRSSKSLSGGEAQRIRLATQIGSLVGCLYILDEPSGFTKR
jgi:excinuclease ABC subunit A